MLLDTEDHTIIIKALELYQERMMEKLSLVPNVNDSTSEKTKSCYRYLHKKAETIKQEIITKKPLIMQ